MPNEDWNEMDYNPLDFLEEEESTDELVDETEKIKPMAPPEPEPKPKTAPEPIEEPDFVRYEPPKPKLPTMEETFHKHLPNTLYMSHYELAKHFGHTPQEWRTFIRDNHLFIETELAAISEAEARSALARLGNASGTEVAAIKALLEKSKLINDSQRQNTKIVMTFITPTDRNPKKEEEKEDDNNNTVL